MQNKIVKNQIQANSELGSQALKAVHSFFFDISRSEMEEILDEMLEAYIHRSSAPPLKDIRDRIYYVSELTLLLEKLDDLRSSAGKEEDL
jgi:hypothetical protein